MRFLLAMSLVAAACSGPQKKAEDPMKDTAQESCCCKWTPMTSEDGMPSYEVSNPMECSGRQGTCVDQVQCQAQDTPAPE
jgi:hypothetical protein